VGELIDSFGFRGRLETVKSGAEETETGQTPFCNGRKRTEVRNALGISVLGCREAEMIKVCAYGHVGIVGKWGLVEAALHMSNDNAHRGGGVRVIRELWESRAVAKCPLAKRFRSIVPVGNDHQSRREVLFCSVNDESLT
jgi:hypothetical protein